MLVPMMAFWVDVDKLKYANDAEVSSLNFTKNDGFPL
jgi:hypothetical protein